VAERKEKSTHHDGKAETNPVAENNEGKYFHPQSCVSKRMMRIACAEEELL
jgi:hypothetical protein